MTQLPQPIADRLFAPGDTLQLLGGRHRDSGRTVFPCPASDAYDPVPLPPRGTLWSYTVQRFRPKSPPYAGPEAFEPYAVGYVELPGAVIVESRIVGVPFDALHIGMEMVVTQETFPVVGGEGTRLSYAFTAVEGDAT